ncbi:uncharacterized protein LOC110857830 [Folsomia candida]|uniref:Transposon Tf2-9 polyprotein n=1 Tax=Folsomia candida TaxID=158441 RepID=A0A226DIH8_FOLCA|nr:uncharacterized protein LOC110857830 [Folsomia candida]OXA44497.1 Transposon Tf2-9 polyprotein [Folsomia candida]
MLIDEGSQVSYIGSRTVNITGSKSKGTEHVKNILLGGYVTELHEESLREVIVKNMLGTIEKTWILREKPIVCTSLPRIPKGPWVDQLKAKGITLSDLDTVNVDQCDVEILIGSDLRGQVMTGRRSNLGDDLYAEETIFGWALGGPLKSNKSHHSNTVISLFQSQLNVQDMWSLDSLGIQDPIQVKTKLQEEEEAKTHFKNNVSRNEDGRYSVGLPWIENRPELPVNKFVAEKRLQSTTRKLKDQSAVDMYSSVFRGWEDEQIVEPVKIEFKEDQAGHYLPHRPVFKPESQTTPVRPVFDASCKSVGKPSLNDCLYKGPNLIELIPSVLHRFRERRFGVVSDIRKAFQMIEVREEDRDYQKFLWWEDQVQNTVKPLRHTRAVFGLTCSPFLLGAVLELHLSHVKQEYEAVARKLLQSMYVDNSVTSFNTMQEYEDFRKISTDILAEAKMDLRQWECSGVNIEQEAITGVLGLVWDRHDDTLSCDVQPVIVDGPVTKRKILSVVAKLFDPIGFTCPATLQPKLMLQEMWRTDKGWDDEVEEEQVSKFMKWCQEIYLLSKIKIPRRMMLRAESSGTQLHLFTDASSYAYAAVIYIRSERGPEVSVQLVQAKARVAPLKGGTIPRLELMGCLIGVRLLNMVRDSLDIRIDREFHWTDSTTALAWIQRGEEWGTFVANRVKEIRSSTSVSNWRHVPGVLNPADLPSRGCPPNELLESKWWEGVNWLKRPEEEWPSNKCEVDEDEVRKEGKGRKRTIMQVFREKSWFHCKFSSFHKTVRVMGWILRFVTNCNKDKTKHVKGSRLSHSEFKVAEHQILHGIQKECLRSDVTELKKKLSVVEKNGLLCVKTRLLNKEDTDCFRWPVILPSDHYLVKMMITDLHKLYSHPGAQFLLCKLRERFWILGGRKAMKRIIRACPNCRRNDVRPLCVEPSALPTNRVTPGEVYETTGVDLAGPVILKDGSKMWIVLFTCSVYRCVAFDVVSSLSTEAFMGAMQRFINIYGRPRTFCSDNGTNFVGVANLLKTLDWEEILQKCDVSAIKWTLNPPSAPWWGGWWERLVRSMKNQLRRMLGKAKLTCEELRTSLSAVQATINDRPLTVLTEDSGDLIPLTPSMFLHPSRSAHFPEGVIVCQSGLEGNYKKMQVVQGQLQQRLRTEYLAQLVQRGNETKGANLKIGDVVLIGAENKKRYEWPIGRIVEIIRGRDGHCRVAKVQTAHDYELKTEKSGQYTVTKVKKGHVLTRPLQRLYPMEISSSTDLPEVEVAKIREKVSEPQCQDFSPIQDVPHVKHTRFGRQIKSPTRLLYWNYEYSVNNDVM